MLAISGPGPTGLSLGGPGRTRPPGRGHQARLGQNICAENFAQLLASASQGRLKVEILDSGSVGDERQILQKVRQGDLELCVVTTGPFDKMAPQVRAVEYPFLFESYKQVDQVLQGPAGRRLLGSLVGERFKGLAFSENGFRNPDQQ